MGQKWLLGDWAKQDHIPERDLRLSLESEAQLFQSSRRPAWRDRGYQPQVGQDGGDSSHRGHIVLACAARCDRELAFSKRDQRQGPSLPHPRERTEKVAHFCPQECRRVNRRL